MAAMTMPFALASHSRDCSFLSSGKSIIAPCPPDRKMALCGCMLCVQAVALCELLHRHFFALLSIVPVCRSA